MKVIGIHNWNWLQVKTLNDPKNNQMNQNVKRKWMPDTKEAARKTKLTRKNYFEEKIVVALYT